MIALYCIGGLLLLLALLLSSPISVRFFYRDTLQIVLRVWGIPMQLLPRPQQTDAVSDTASAEKSEKKPSLLKQLQESFAQDGVGATLHWVSEMARLLQTAVGKLFRAITVKTLQLEMRISGEDASQIALRYGEFCAVFYPAFGAVSTALRIQKSHIDLRPDFAAEGGAALLDATVRVCLWRLLGAAITCGFMLLKIYLKTDTDVTNGKEGTHHGREQ